MPLDRVADRDDGIAIDPEPAVRLLILLAASPILAFDRNARHCRLPFQFRSRDMARDAGFVFTADVRS